MKRVPTCAASGCVRTAQVLMVRSVLNHSLSGMSCPVAVAAARLLL